MTDISNGNGRQNPGLAVNEQDACGHAALLLVESVLHGLVEQSVFSVEKAVELVDIAAEVKSIIGAELGDSPATLRRSVALFGAISTSLQIDRPL